MEIKNCFATEHTFNQHYLEQELNRLQEKSKVNQAQKLKTMLSFFSPKQTQEQLLKIISRSVMVITYSMW